MTEEAPSHENWHNSMRRVEAPRVIARKALFVAVALPLLSIVGGIGRAFGWPRLATLVTLAVLFTICFVLWTLLEAHTERERALDMRHLEELRRREQRLQAERALAVEEQKALMELAARQRAETRELAERHRREYEELVKRHSA